MKLIFLGTGSAFTVGADNYQSNMLLEDDEQKRLLIDCGNDVRLALFELGYTYRDINSVYVSHLHADHVGGMEWLAFTTYFDKVCQKPTLYIPEVMLSDLWNKVLSGGLSSLQGKNADLKTFFKIKAIKNNSYFRWSHSKIHIIQTIHVMSEYTIIPSYGLLFNANGKRVFVTTDTQFEPHLLMDFYKNADIIFHDCETARVLSGVHAHYKELLTLDKDIKKKIWLYHYNPGQLPNAKKDGFLGFVKKGQCFDFSDEKTLFVPLLATNKMPKRLNSNLQGFT